MEYSKSTSSGKDDKRKKQNLTGFEEWGGYMAAKKRKLNDQFKGQRPTEINEENSDPAEIFKGISIYVNGYTDPPADELKRLMMVHGGNYCYYFSSKTTHTIASNLPNSKFKNLKTQIVVTADWITDSIKAKKLLSHQNYLLYSEEKIHKQNTLNKYVASKNSIPDIEVSISVQEPELFGTAVNQTTASSSSCMTEAQVSDFEISANRLSNYQELSSYDLETNLFDTCEKASAIHSRTSDSLNIQNSSYKSSSSVTDLSSNDNFSESSSLKTTPLSGEDSNLTLEDQNSSDLHFSNKNLTAEFPHHVDKKHLNASCSTLTEKSSVIDAAHPDFLTEFYNHSRLHHISTAGQELKLYVRELMDQNKERIFPKRIELQKSVCDLKNDIIPDTSPDSSLKQMKVVMHLDMDCFFVSVGLRKHPELKGLPVAVTHSKGKRGGPSVGSDITYEYNYYSNKFKEKTNDSGENSNALNNEEPIKILKNAKEFGSMSEIASCSYEARKAGLRNGMFLGEALRRCPNLKTIPYDFEEYSEVSKQLYSIVSSYTLDIEAGSCDELFIDCSELLHDVKMTPDKFACILRAEIFEKTKCTASAGMGCNKLVARLASKVAKPNGQHYIVDSEVESFMKTQKVSDLPGVGYSTSSKLKTNGVKTCEDLQSWPLPKLQKEFGRKTGLSLFNRCRGKDERLVQSQKDRKSVSAEINYGIRFTTEDEVYNFINKLAMEVQKRLNGINSKGKAITLKLMVRRPDAPSEPAKFMGHGVCENVSKSTILRTATDSSKVICKECRTLSRILKINPQDYRGVGIQVSKLEPCQKDEQKYCKIKSFLSSENINNSCNGNKADSSKQSSEFISNVVIKNSAKNNTLSITKNTAKTFKMADYIPQELNESILDTLPEDLKQEVLDTCDSLKNHKNADSNNEFSQVSTSKCVEEDPATKNLMFEGASLAGAVDIDEVQSLIKEWTESTEDPLEVDAADIQTYLSALIQEDLQKVEIILKHLFKMVKNCNKKWKQTYLSVLSFVQKKALQKYGTVLDVMSEFSPKH